MSDALPWVKFDFDRWRSDERLRMCSFAARGLWLDLLAIMHNSEPYGHLTLSGRPPTIKQIAAMCGGTTDEVAALLAELEANGVFSKTADGVIFSRRLVRDEAQRIIDIENGRKGGNPNLKPRPNGHDSGVHRLKVVVNPPVKGVVNPPVNPEERRGRGKGHPGSEGYV